MSVIDRKYIREACELLEYSLEEIEEESGLFFLNNGETQIPLVLGLMPINLKMSGYIATHKYLTHQLLEKVGIRVPKTIRITKPLEINSDVEEKLSSFLKTVNFPLFLKPENGTQGRGITMINSLQELVQKGNFLFKNYKTLLLQEYIEAPEFRCFVIDEQVKYIYRRIPAKVIGDGEKTFEELIQSLKEKTDLNLEFGIDRNYILKQLLAIESSWQTILPKGEIIKLSYGVSYKSGSTFSSLQFDVPESWSEWIKTISKTMNLRVFSIDFFNLGNTLNNPEDFVVIEINSRPYFTFFEQTPHRSFAVNIWAEILQKAFKK